MIELKYKNYIGSAEIDLDDNTLRGKLLFIRDLVTYEANSPAELKNEFEAAIDEYLDDCVAIEKEPDKPFKGVFNVRIRPSLHREIARCALKDSKSLNEYVSSVLDKHLDVFEVSESNLNKVESVFISRDRLPVSLLKLKAHGNNPDPAAEGVRKSWGTSANPIAKDAEVGWAINKTKETVQ